VAFVSQIDQDRRHFDIVSVAADTRASIRAGASDALIDTYCKLVIDGELPTVIPDAFDSSKAADLEITGKLGIRSYLSAPIVLASGEVFGTLCCFSSAPRPDLREADAQALRAVADAIAASIERDGELLRPIWR